MGGLGQRRAAGEVLLSGYAPINYRGLPPVAPITNRSRGLRQWPYRRRHFALGDGSVRFIQETIDNGLLARLCVRNDGGVGQSRLSSPAPQDAPDKSTIHDAAP